jgi:hypothetical protein
MIRFGMHSSLWTASWTREAAEMLIPEAAAHGLEVIGIASVLSVWCAVARHRYEVLEKGVPYLKSLAALHGLTGAPSRTGQ